MTSQGHRLSPAEHDRLYRQSGAGVWGLDAARFAAAVERSLDSTAPPAGEDTRSRFRRAAALHLEDLAVASACAEGNDGAWDHFMRQYRPALYRAADALDPSGGAREVADGLYAELYGLPGRDGHRRSLLTYYHARSTLATWLRAVLAQRLVDRARQRRRTEPLPDDTGAPVPAPLSVGPNPIDPDRVRSAGLLRYALAAAIAALAARDRWRLACYYQQQLTLAETGRLLAEHEATVSRRLAHTRRALHAGIEERLLAHGLTKSAIAECLETAAGDAGALDLDALLGASPGKNPPPDRSS